MRIIFNSRSLTTFTRRPVYIKGPAAASEEVAITKLEVPEYALLGDNVELVCHWSVPREMKLYSVKWYFNDREFFRYKPEENPILYLHPIAGIRVDKELSRPTGERVILSSVDVNTSGQYKCEVIAEWPNFFTTDRSAPMTVLEIPEEKPVIYGTKHQYHVGDTANLTCISARSRPPAQLTWFINDEEAPIQYLVPMTSSQYPGGLVETRLGLHFRVTRQHFLGGEMTVRCSAKISSLYYKTQQHSVDGHMTYSVPVMESRDVSAVSGCGPRAGGARAVMVMVVVAALERWSW
nr:cell adhesion molecule 3-like isoform X2 [Procambarus clarkii]